ncbi:MAG: polyprenyl synthetase family protein [Pirellulaceae bacterium]|nr:polyprenyl synthetase family protein [Pirellulaceae bacterium]
MINDNAVPTAVQMLYAPIQDHLDATESVLKRELHSKSPFVDDLLQYGGKLGGKRLRPALLLLTATATGDVTSDHHTLAAVLEMIHTATLVHDDVLDEADMRRHLATVNARWNNESSVLLGDYLFSHAFFLASTLDSTYACRRIGRSTNIVCEGELRQIGNRGNHALSEEEYYAIINGKTAELCACACHLGARYALASTALVEGMERFGRHLGMAFQISDDLLDLTGDEGDTGKSLGTDLEKQKPTLPIIRLYARLTGSDRDRLVSLLESSKTEHRANLRSWLDQSGVLDEARQTADQFATKASKELEQLPPSLAQTVLNEIASYVVNRKS